MTSEVVTILIPAAPLVVTVPVPGATTAGAPDRAIVDRAGAYVRNRAGDYIRPR